MRIKKDRGKTLLVSCDNNYVQTNNKRVNAMYVIAFGMTNNDYQMDTEHVYCNSS